MSEKYYGVTENNKYYIRLGVGVYEMMDEKEQEEIRKYFRRVGQMWFSKYACDDERTEGAVELMDGLGICRKEPEPKEVWNAKRYCEVANRLDGETIEKLIKGGLIKETVLVDDDWNVTTGMAFTTKGLKFLEENE